MLIGIIIAMMVVMTVPTVIIPWQRIGREFSFWKVLVRINFIFSRTRLK